MAGPEGGDAKKLCAAFGSDAVKEVEGILRKPFAEDNGYVFAMERHGDLAAALGIPSFGVGSGFELISSGELPEDLNGNELVKSKDLLPPGHLWKTSGANLFLAITRSVSGPQSQIEAVNPVRMDAGHLGGARMPGAGTFGGVSQSNRPK